MPSFWYPEGLAARIPFHANFSANATATGTTYGLTAPQVTQAASDSTNVEALVNFKEAIEAYAQAVTEWTDAILEGETFVAPPPAPPAPGAPTMGPGSLTGIRDRTITYANIIKADIDY